MEAINRITELGFNQQNVIRAFLLCDRNEILTTNYLFEQAGVEYVYPSQPTYNQPNTLD